MPPKIKTLTASNTVTTSPARVVSVILTPGSTSATITLKDSASGNTGTAHLGTFTGGTAGQSTQLPGERQQYALGIYALLSPGFDGTALVFYEPL